MEKLLIIGEYQLYKEFLKQTQYEQSNRDNNIRINSRLNLEIQYKDYKQSINTIHQVKGLIILCEKEILNQDTLQDIQNFIDHLQKFNDNICLFCLVNNRGNKDKSKQGFFCFELNLQNSKSFKFIYKLVIKKMSILSSTKLTDNQHKQFNKQNISLKPLKIQSNNMSQQSDQYNTRKSKLSSLILPHVIQSQKSFSMLQQSQSNDFDLNTIQEEKLQNFLGTNLQQNQQQQHVNFKKKDQVEKIESKPYKNKNQNMFSLFKELENKKQNEENYYQDSIINSNDDIKSEFEQKIENLDDMIQMVKTNIDDVYENQNQKKKQSKEIKNQKLFQNDLSKIEQYSNLDNIENSFDKILNQFEFDNDETRMRITQQSSKLFQSNITQKNKLKPQKLIDLRINNIRLNVFIDDDAQSLSKKYFEKIHIKPSIFEMNSLMKVISKTFTSELIKLKRNLKNKKFHKSRTPKKSKKSKSPNKQYSKLFEQKQKQQNDSLYYSHSSQISIKKNKSKQRKILPFDIDQQEKQVPPKPEKIHSIKPQKEQKNQVIKQQQQEEKPEDIITKDIDKDKKVIDIEIKIEDDPYELALKIIENKNLNFVHYEKIVEGIKKFQKNLKNQLISKNSNFIIQCIG